LNSASRWPYILVALGCGCRALSSRFGTANGPWGPYEVDQFDVFYGIFPAAAGAICGVCLRRIIERMNRKAIIR
jgi:hypothetical protein